MPVTYSAALEAGRGGDTSDAARLAVIIEVSAGAWGIVNGDLPYAFDPETVWLIAIGQGLRPEHVELALRQGGVKTAVSMLAGPWQTITVDGRPYELRLLRKYEDPPGTLTREYENKRGGATVRVAATGRRGKRAAPEEETARTAAERFAGYL